MIFNLDMELACSSETFVLIFPSTLYASNLDFFNVLQIGIDRTGTWAVDGFCAGTKSIEQCPQIFCVFLGE